MRRLPAILIVAVLTGAFGVYFITQKSKPADAAWYNASWGYRKQITVDKNKVAGGSDLTNFPMLFSVTDPDLKYTSFGGKVGTTGGTDILFTSSDGSTKLSHEIEKYASSTGETIIWVKIPTLSASSDTVLYVYFGNSGASDQQDTANVWTGQTYRGVYHLANTTDSKNGRNLTTDGTQTASGKIDGAYSFNGTSQEAYGGNYDADNDANLTMSIWVTPLNHWESTEGDSRIFDLISGGDTNGCEIAYDSSVDATLEFKCTLPSVGMAGATYTANFPANVPMYIVATFDDTNDLQKLYVNGVNVGTNGTYSQSILYNTGVTMYADIAARITGLDKFSDMIADEARIVGGVLTAGWIQTEYNNQSDPGSFYAYGALGVQTVSNLPAASATAGADWYNASWTYRRQITIDHTKVATSSSLSNFPVLFSVTDSEFKYTSYGGKVGTTGGTDILFTSSDGTTKLSHQIDKYASSTGETVAWVKIPTLSAVTDTVLYMYYGNSGAADQQDTANVWDSNYKLVWHLADGVTLAAPDSTSNANNGTVSSATATTGKIGGGGNFSGSSQEITRANTASIGVGAGDSTVSAWFYVNAYASAAAVYDKGASGSRDYSFFISSATGGHIAYGNSGGSGWTGTSFTSGTWHYLTIVQTGGVATVYLDGIQNFTKAVIVAANTSATLSLGGNPSTGGSYWNGKLDEFRVSGAVRGSDWIQTEYNNQSDPGSFYALGATQTQSRSVAGVEVDDAASTGGAWYNASWTYRRQITVDHTKVATSSSLSNFPMLFSVTDSELKYTSFGGRVGKTDGTDILFTSSDGTTKLSHEIEKYSSSTGETIIWINVTTLSGTSDTVLYMYYGNSGAADQQSATSTWDSFYKAVYHLANGTTLSLNDSTTNAYHLTNNSTVYPATGYIDGGASATSTAAFAKRSTMSALAYNSADIITIEAWVKRISTTSYRPIISLVKAGSSSKRNLEFDFNGGGVGESVSNSIAFHYRESGDVSWASYYHNVADTDVSTYHHYVFTYTFASSTTAKLYVDGKLVGGLWANTGNAGPVTDVDTLVLFNTQDVASEMLSGYGDEIRLSKGIARGSDWVSTEYNNQSDPASFYSFGATQTSSKSGAGGTGSAPAVKVRGQVKVR